MRQLFVALLTVALAGARPLHALPPSTTSSAPAMRVVSTHRDGILGTSFDATFVSAVPGASAEAMRVALAEIERLRRVLSSWDDHSELAQLFARGSLLHPSPDLVAVLEQYDAWVSRSTHAYSARIGELSALWRDAERQGVAPDSLALAAVVQRIASPAWERDPSSGAVRALTPQRVDLNSLGKGFIIDRALEAVRMRVPAVRGALINIGGDVHVWGEAPHAEGWRIGVADPASHADNAKPLTQLRVAAGAVSSSGNYERGFRIGGRWYSHILDPRTGQPSQQIAGVTVVAADNATANALATTLSVLSVGEGLALVQRTPGAHALLMTASGQQIRSPGFSRYEVPAATTRPTDAVAAPTFTAKLNIDVSPTVANRHQPFVAVWITDTTGKHVRTLAFWGDKPKYQREMTKWWGLLHGDAAVLDAVTRATRAVGKYTLDWDGLDQSGAAVGAGSYMFWLEVAFEDGAHSAKNVTLSCGAADTNGSIPQAAAFTGATVTCEKAKK